MIPLTYEIDLFRIKEKLGNQLVEVFGNTILKVNHVASLGNNIKNAFVFCNKLSDKNRDLLKYLENCIILLPNDADMNSELQVLKQSNLIVKVKNPRLGYCLIIEFKDNNFIHQKSIIDDNCVYGDNFSVGAYSVIGNCRIGNNVKIGHNVIIEDGTIIGDHVHIQSGTIIGTSGFGFEKDDQGQYHEFVHLGNVIIGNHVSLGANNCIDKGALGSTVIGDGVKTDNLVHIAHNCHIGNNCILTAMTELSGSVKVGSGVWFSPCSSVINGVTIGDDAFIGISAVVTKDVPAKHRLIPAFSTLKPPKE